MKKSGILFIFSAGLFLYACKHEILNPSQGTGTPVTPVEPPATQEICFEADILPIFQSSCAKSGCHNSTSAQKGYVFDSYENIMKKDIKPGNASGSKVYKVLIDPDEDDRMPRAPFPRLLPTQIGLIKKWIDEGAKNTTGCAANSCDTSVFTYTAVNKIIEANCLNCHSGVNPAGGLNYSTHAGLKAVADNGKLVGAVSHAPGFTPMPLNLSKLSDCQVTQIRKWVEAGAPNN